VTFLDIAEMLAKVMANERLPKAAVDSARRRGIYPLNPDAAQQFVRKENPTIDKHADEVYLAAQIVASKIGLLRDQEIKQQVAKLKSKEDKHAALATSYARELTEDGWLQQRAVQRLITEVKTAKTVDALKQLMRDKLHFTVSIATSLMSIASSTYFS